MNSEDGRLVSNFVVAALRGEPIRIYGDGSQTRSLLSVPPLSVIARRTKVESTRIDIFKI